MAKTVEHSFLNEVIADISVKEDIKRQLTAMGLGKGMLVLVEANSNMLGYISGSHQALIEAIMECVGYEGTIVMPSFTPQMLDPACIKNCHIDRESWQYIRDGVSGFDKKLSAPLQSDELVLQFMRNEGVARSYHPLYSFLAWGKYAKIICDKHPLHFGLSKDSPLGKLYELNGYVLLLGCGFEDCTMLHLAHYNGQKLPIHITSAPIERNNRVYWKDMLDLELNKEGFLEIGEVMEERKIVRTMYLGSGRCRFFSAREATNIATAYFNINEA